MTEFDEIDRELIRLLQADDRVSVAEIGKRLGAPPSTLNDRIRRLVRTGTITGFHAHVAADKIGLELLAYVFLGWSDPSSEAALLDRAATATEILECHRVTGDWTYLLKLRLADNRDLERFLAQLTRDVPGLERVKSLVVLSTAKETTAVEPPVVSKA